MKNKQIKIPSHNDSKVIGFGLSVIFIVFGLVGGWMYYAPLASSAVAIGKVSADMEKKTIQHLEGGIVGSINVKDGDEVKKGDILLKMDDIKARGQIEQIEKQINGANSLIETKVIRIESLDEEIQEWEKLYEKRLVDKQRIRELKREKNLVQGDILSTRSEIARLKEQKIIIEDILSRTNIIAPIDGTVVGLDIHTNGAIINPGTPILELIPKDSKLLILAQVQTTDIDKVRIGLLAEVRFSAFNLKQAEVVEGRVIYVSADSFIDKVSGAPYYQAKIELTEEGVKNMQKNGFFLLPGMPAEVMINTGERTALSYLIKPFNDMLSRSFNEE